eukprot:scaffold385_cov182-Ochromonas_danica.AAC.19
MVGNIETTWSSLTSRKWCMGDTRCRLVKLLPVSTTLSRQAGHKRQVNPACHRIDSLPWG